ncbi:hypothetical protein [Legionella rowbothamii]|uniref:hypothetical protein n=1 Tax=Legionella rowbothamii TaxID=96229 RepID=UPI00105522C0|nr:hypothetical protein [Legionella rowbothamii]
MFLITNYNFNEQVIALANGTVTENIIDFNLKWALTTEELGALEKALNQNKQEPWGFKISRDVPLDARAALLQSLPKFCSQIQYLNIEFPALTENDVVALENIITNNKTALEIQLVLDKTFITNGFLKLLKSIQSSQNLAKLGIYNTPFSNETQEQLVGALAVYLKNNTSLEELAFYDIDFNQQNIDLVLEALANNYSVQQIYTTEYVEPIEMLLARNKAMTPIFKSLKDDFDNNNFYPIPLSFHEQTKSLTDDERAALIHQLERSKHTFAPLVCAYLLFPETSFYNLVASFIDESSPTDETKSHAAITFLFQASTNPQFKGLADTILYYLKAGSPFESVINRLSTFYINPDERYTKMSFSPDSFMDDRGPTAMPAIPLDPPTQTNPSTFFAQNRNTPTNTDDEENDHNYESKAP